MRCTKEQYEAIKPKLKNVSFINISLSFDYCCFLVNNFRGINKDISNVDSPDAKRFGRKVYEDWDEQIFLSAFGIETEPTYTLTKEQLKSITDPKVQEWFPEVFEVKLETGKWYVFPGYPKFITFVKENHRRYGLDIYGNWFNNGYEVINPKDYRQASFQEVDEAMKKEAAKRGLAKGCFFKCLRTGKIFPVIKKEPLSDNKASERVIFLNGVWADVVTLEKRKYYTDDEGWFCFDGNFDNQGCPIGYGVNKVGEWRYKKGWQDFNGLVEMTESQIEQVLKTEALKKYKIGDFIKSIHSGNIYKIYEESFNKNMDGLLCLNDVVIFKDGNWSEIIPLKTKAEAEAEFNIKIVD